MEDGTLWVGIDLGSKSHQVCVLNAMRQVILEREVAHEGAALTALADELIALAGGVSQRIRAALETPQSAVVEMLLERGIDVFTLNPKQLDRFRDRHSAAGSKDDRRDAFVLGDSLSTDQRLFKQVLLGPAQVVELRALTRIREELVTEDNALSNRVDAELLRFYPEIRALGSVQCDPWLLDLLDLAPTPAQARTIRLPQLRLLLKRNRIRKHTAEGVHAVLQRCSVRVAPGVSESSSRHIKLLIPRIRLVREQARECERDLERMLESLSEPEAGTQGQRDAAIVQSLPGVGTIVSATLLAEAWQPLAERDYGRLRVLSGVAPVTKQSGKMRLVSMRKACNPRLRQCMVYWAISSVRLDARAKSQYAQYRARGHSHGRALRGIADRQLNLLMALLRRGELFDPARWTLKVA